MTDAIKTGTILIEGGAAMPASLGLEGGAASRGWRSIGNKDLSQVNTAIQQAGWTFFFMAGEIKIIAFGWDKEQATRRAVKRVLENVESQYCNCVEFTAVSAKSFLGMPYASVSGHSRHIQKSSTFTGFQQELTTTEKL
jgi:hypothetical protein